MELIDRIPLLEMLAEKKRDPTKNCGGYRHLLYGSDRDEYDVLERMEEILENEL